MGISRINDLSLFYYEGSWNFGYASKETENGFALEVALAGYGKDDVSVFYNETKNILQIATKDKKFDKSFKLFKKLDDFTVTMENGLLTVHAEEQEDKLKEIKVK